MQRALPAWTDLKQAIDQARPRPVEPVYSYVSEGIYKNVNRALRRDATPEEALRQAQAEMEVALRGQAQLLQVG